MAKTTTSDSRPENARSGTVLIETDTKRLIVYDGKFWNAFDSEFRIATKNAQDVYSVYTTNYVDSERARGWTGMNSEKYISAWLGGEGGTAGGTFTLWFCTDRRTTTESHMLISSVVAAEDLNNKPTIALPENDPNSGWIGIKGSTLYMQKHPVPYNTWWTPKNYAAGKNLCDGQWHNLTVTYQFIDVNGTLHVEEQPYIDGVSLGTNTTNQHGGSFFMWYSLQHTSLNRMMVLGGPNFSTGYGNFPGIRGWLGDFAIWDRPLSNYDINEIYQSRGAHLFNDQLDPNRFFLKHWWKMGDDQPTAIAVNRSQDFIFDSQGDENLYTHGYQALGTDTQPAIDRPIFTTFTASQGERQEPNSY